MRTTSERGQTVDEKWKDMSKIMMKAAEEVCGNNTGRRKDEKETWWWKDEIQHTLKEKKNSMALHDFISSDFEVSSSLAEELRNG